MISPSEMISDRCVFIQYPDMKTRLNKSQLSKLPGFEDFFLELENAYHVTREQILEAVSELGLVKGRIRTFFLVRRHLNKKQRV
jgi:hypothetical protein